MVRGTIGKVTPCSVSDIATHTDIRSIDGLNDPEFISDIRKDIGKLSVYVTLSTLILKFIPG